MTTSGVRTTITLPAELLAAVDQVIAEGAARSRNDLLAAALRDLLAARRRAAIDADFVGMGSDEDYLAESALLERGLDASSWEALLIALDLPGQAP